MNTNCGAIKSDKTESSVPSAVCTITVGADPLPVVPAGLQAQQLSLNSTGLRWNLDETKSSARVIAYKIYRTSNGQRQLLNDQSLLVGPVQDLDGNYADPVIYYTDVKAKPGQIKYEVVGLDAFDRQTQPAVLDFPMADWETPLPVKEIGSVVNGGSAFLYWASSMKTTPSVKDDMAFYNVYRADTEENANREAEVINGKKVMLTKKLLTWTKLNSEPIKPVYIPAPKSTSKKKLASVVAKMTSLCFTDKTVQIDHNYRYCVTALYQKNNMESAPSPEELVPVPDQNLPAPVTQVTGKCTPLYTPNPTFAFESSWAKSYKTNTVPIARVRNLRADPAVMAAANPASVTPSGYTKTNNTTIATQYASRVVAATVENSDLGSRVVLTWNPAPLTAPVKYRIYRSNASGYQFVKNSAKHDSDDSQKGGIPAMGMSAAQSNAGGSKQSQTNTGTSGASVVKKSLAVIGNRQFGYVQKIDLSLLLDRDYKLIAETTSPSYVDPLPKSRPMYYAYRITATNRWGIEGKPADLFLRIPATVKPPTAQLASAVPNQDGGVTLIWRPLEDSDECRKYIVYRKMLNLSDLIVKYQPVGLSLIRSKSDEKSGGLPNMALSAAQSGVGGASMQSSASAKIMGSNAVVAQSVLNKANNKGLRTRQSLPIQSAEFRKNLRNVMASLDYQSVGEITTFTVDPNGYIRYSDTKNVAANEWYSYTLRAVDADSWTSDAGKPVMSTVWKVKVPAVSNLKATADSTKRGIELQWSAPPGEIMGYVVQKAVGGGTEFIQISGTSKELRFVDFSALTGRKSLYRVLAIDTTGNLSDPAVVEFMLPKSAVRNEGVTIKKPNDQKIKIAPGILK